jgi:hypothetical protein
MHAFHFVARLWHGLRGKGRYPWVLGGTAMAGIPHKTGLANTKRYSSGSSDSDSNPSPATIEKSPPAGGLFFLLGTFPVARGDQSPHVTVTVKVRASLPFMVNGTK